FGHGHHWPAGCYFLDIPKKKTKKIRIYSMDGNNIVITGIARTPLGNFSGAFKQINAVTLGAEVIRALISRTGLKPAQIDEVLMGCVLPAGLGQAPARQAALNGGLPVSVPATTIS